MQRKRMKVVNDKNGVGVIVSPETETETKSAPCFSRLSPPPPTNEARQRLLSLVCLPAWKSRKSSLQSVKQIDLAAFSDEAESMFLELCAAGSGLTVREILSATAYHIGLSTETAKRYLQKHSAIGAELELREGKVYERPNDV